MVRVISGTAGGLKLQTLDSGFTRPTLGRVKEAVFSMIREEIFAASVLDLFAGNGALAVPVVTFGNRSFDNSLAELCASLENAGFHTIAAGAFACQHAFSDTLAAGRPDREDMTVLAQLGAAVVTKLGKMTEIPAPVQVDGDADAPYYRPLGLDGEPKNFLKAKPQTDRSKCTGCGVCAALCPMGSISREDPAEVTGVCIKCHSCVRNCPTGAKYFDDEAFLSHKAMLERDYPRRAEDKIFL